MSDDNHFHFERARIRLQCLNLAVLGREGHSASDLVAVADQLSSFVMGDTPSEEEFTLGDAAKGVEGCEAQAADQGYAAADTSLLSPHYYVMETVQELRRQIGRIALSREVAIAQTKLDEMVLWLQQDFNNSTNGA